MPPETQPVLDKDKALAICSGDESLFEELAAIFLVDAMERMDGLTEALAAGDAKGVERYAHAIKGLSANICAEPVKQAASSLEIAGREGQREHWQALHRQLKTEMERLRTHLTQILPPQNA